MYNQTVSDPLDRIVRKFTVYENLDRLVEAECDCVPLVWGCSRHERFQLELLFDCYDNLCILRNRRRPDGSFRQARRDDDGKRNGVTLDRILANTSPSVLGDKVTCWTIRQLAYRRAWMYYANRPMVNVVGSPAII